ncbi:MAG: ATP-binding protein [Micromonosporaceae bacterium]
MSDFVGRKRELALLNAELDGIRAGSSRPGRCLLLRGRRRVGKSRLVEEFVEQADVPTVFYTASGVAVRRELAQFTDEVMASDLPGRERFEGVSFDGWDSALRLLADALPADGPSVVVIDELPHIVAADSRFEGTLQRVWDRHLSRKPVLLILVGSELSMMEALNTYGRPFHQRSVPMTLDPLNPHEVGAMLDLAPAEAFDAYLVTGGLPLICAEWSRGASLHSFLRRALERPTSALAVSGELALAAEFPVEAQARRVLSAIGSGERTRAMIQRAASELPVASLDRALKLLLEKRVIVVARPLSVRPSRETRYYVADSYLRFWLYFIGAHRSELDRGRHDRVLERIERDWTSWRGRAVEPVIREALLSMGPDERLPDVGAVGGYWTRTNDVEVDLVGADRTPIAREIAFVGSIKWLERRPLDHHDLAELIAHSHRVPGVTDETLLIAVSRAGSRVGDAVAAAYGPDELITAWPG